MQDISPVERGAPSLLKLLLLRASNLEITNKVDIKVKMSLSGQDKEKKVYRIIKWT